MARSSTSFKPGNRSAARPGTKLALKHGADSPEEIAKRLPAIRERVYAELAEVPYLTRPDNSIVERYVRLTAQAEMREEYWDATGGMWQESGKAKPGFHEYMLIIGGIEKFVKVLGLGPHPRAQVLQAFAGAGKDIALINAARERAREKLRLLSA